ncbi:hypothetical protein UCDDA912_g02206 [Diaporthe ampelina]|uniref:Uncharacterized protein n=1 Tax=Diaporthe ampelina TaxID=1214573 RepID=A0A0G2FUV6_9PEZI|nr:hypothetical protein UCDDA912_g02206 [Diaporthe ampelina]
MDPPPDPEFQPGLAALPLNASPPVPASYANDDPVVSSDNPDRQALRSHDDVTPEMRENLRDLLHKLQAIHFRDRRSMCIGDTDFQNLLDEVFTEGWVTGRMHQMCGENYFESNIKNIAAQVHLFDKDVIGALASEKAKEASSPYDMAGRLDTKKNRKKAPEAFIKVYVTCTESEQLEGVATFVYHDEDYNVLPDGVQNCIALLSGDAPLANAQGRALIYHDRFELSRCREHNLQAAVYLARNRLTHWANGNDVKSRPEHEEEVLFVEYDLMRYLECTEESAMVMCRKRKIPALWEDRVWTGYNEAIQSPL